MNFWLEVFAVIGFHHFFMTFDMLMNTLFWRKKDPHHVNIASEPSYQDATSPHESNYQHEYAQTTINALTSSMSNSTNEIHVSGNCNTITMNAQKGSSQVPDPLPLLSQHATRGAEIDASARHPPPKCHPGTRETLLKAIFSWVTSDQQVHKMFWLHGPAGVGKSAVAQTFAESCQEKDLFVVPTFFLSRPNKRDNPESIFITLAYQICVQIKEYREIIGHLLAKDPHLPDRHFNIQFWKLIIEPLSTMRTRRKLVFVIDGLDECRGEDAQCEIVDLIIQAADSESTRNLHILWFISSRPELHLKPLLTGEDTRRVCWIEELQIDSLESRDDASRFITEEFGRIQRKHRQILDVSWPGEGRLIKVITASSGLFAFASTVIRFIDTPNLPNPEGQLKKIMNIIDTTEPTTTKRHRNPLELLDALYLRILSEIDEEVLPITLDILHYLCILPMDDFLPAPSAQGLTNFLSLDRYLFWSALGKLHSVLLIPSPQYEARLLPLKFLHASFQDFLKDPIRSGSFCLNQDSRKLVLHFSTRACNILESDISLSLSATSEFQAEDDELYAKMIAPLTWPVVSPEEVPTGYINIQNIQLAQQVARQALLILKHFEPSKLDGRFAEMMEIIYNGEMVVLDSSRG